METDERIEAIRQVLVRVSELIDSELKTEENGLGYALVVFPHGASEEPGTTAFVARGQNEDIATAVALVSHLLEQPGQADQDERGGPGDDDGETVH